MAFICFFSQAFGCTFWMQVVIFTMLYMWWRSFWRAWVRGFDRVETVELAIGRGNLQWLRIKTEPTTWHCRFSHHPIQWMSGCRLWCAKTAWAGPFSWCFVRCQSPLKRNGGGQGAVTAKLGWRGKVATTFGPLQQESHEIWIQLPKKTLIGIDMNKPDQARDCKWDAALLQISDKQIKSIQIQYC